MTYCNASYANLYITTMLEGVRDIFEKKSISKARYTELYTLGYKICNLPAEERKTAGDQLYEGIDTFLKARTVTVMAKFQNGVGGMDLIQLFSKEWKEYSFKSKILGAVCAYFDKYWIGKRLEEGDMGYKEIFQLALEAWDTAFQVGLKIRLAAAFGQSQDESPQQQTDEGRQELLKTLTHFLAKMSSRPVSIDAIGSQSSLFGKLKEYFEEGAAA